MRELTLLQEDPGDEDDPPPPFEPPPQPGTGNDPDDGYINPAERRRRSERKQREARDLGLTPDWFLEGDELCLIPTRVAIIGGGFAGLCAAWYLDKCGVEVVVYEFSDHVGGRVNTSRTFIARKVTEFGAELIGENHPLWLILAREFGLRMEPLTDDDDYIARGLEVRLRLNGRFFSKTQRARLKRELYPHLITLGQEAKDVNPFAPWTHANAAALDGQSVGSRIAAMGLSADARRLLEFTLENDNCLAVSQQSLLGLLAAISAGRMESSPPGDPRGMLGYWFSTETDRCRGGNQLLAERIRDRLNARARRRRRSPVVRVNEPVELVNINMRRLGREVRVTTPTGSEFFHFAILTPPKTVWNGIAVNPDFNRPARSITHGPAVKHFSAYPTAFWETLTPRLAPTVKSDELGSLWEGTDKQPAPPPGFCLAVFSGGPFVQAGGGPTYRTKVDALYPRDLTNPDHNLDREHFQNWDAVAGIRAGYAVPALCEVTTIGPRLRIPHASRLYFAGEQTHMGFFGYMEGALESGSLAALDIMLRRIVPCPPVGIFL
jgi:monoamine oxidase